MAQQLEGGGWFWFLDYGAGTKGHQGAPEVPNSPSHAILVTSEKLQAEARHAKKIKKQQKQRTYNLLMKIKKNIKTLQNCRCQAKQSTAYFFIRQVPTLSTRVSKAPFCKAFLGVPQGQHDCDTGCSRLGTPKPIFRNQNVRVNRVIIYISLYIYKL